MFLTETDLTSKIRQSDLQQIVGSNDAVVPHAMATAEGVARSILADRFDVDKLFSADTDHRELIIVGACVDIAIYEIVVLAQPNIDLTDRRERAQAATRYLRDLADGKYSVAWPLRPNNATDESTVQSGGRPSRGNYF